MTAIQQTIVLVSIIGTILSEYSDEESTPAIKELKRVCSRFMSAQSGIKMFPFAGAKIVRPTQHKRFFDTVMIGDKVWKKALDRYAKQSVTIDAVATVTAIYNFRPQLLAKHAHISSKRIEAYKMDNDKGDAKFQRQGAVIGGYIIEILAEEMGIKINGRLGALKNKVQSDLGRVV